MTARDVSIASYEACHKSISLLPCSLFVWLFCFLRGHTRHRSSNSLPNIRHSSRSASGSHTAGVGKQAAKLAYVQVRREWDKASEKIRFRAVARGPAEVSEGGWRGGD